MGEAFVANHIINLPHTDKIAFDIGANIGAFSRLLAWKFGAVYAFEPDPKNIAKFKSKLDKALDLFFDDVKVGNTEAMLNVFLIEKAISDRSGSASRFYTSNTNPGGHTLNPAVAATKSWGHDPERFALIDTISIDDFVREKGLRDVTLMKVDIEGGEDFVFKGAKETLASQGPDIILEIHKTVDCPRLYKFFRDLGYRWFDDKYQEVKVVHHDKHYFLSKRSP